MDARGQDGTPASLVTTAADNTVPVVWVARALAVRGADARPHLGRLVLASVAMAVLALATGVYVFLGGAGPPVPSDLAAPRRWGGWRSRGGAAVTAGRHLWPRASPVVLGRSWQRCGPWPTPPSSPGPGSSVSAPWPWLRRGLLDALLPPSPVQLAVLTSGDSSCPASRPTSPRWRPPPLTLVVALDPRRAADCRARRGLGSGSTGASRSRRPGGAPRPACRWPG